MVLTGALVDGRLREAGLGGLAGLTEVAGLRVVAGLSKIADFVAAGVLTLEFRRHYRRILNFCLMALGGDPPDAMRTNPCANGREDRDG
jgi:hypothetical protein